MAFELASESTSEFPIRLRIHHWIYHRVRLESCSQNFWRLLSISKPMKQTKNKAGRGRSTQLAEVVNCWLIHRPQYWLSTFDSTLANTGKQVDFARRCSHIKINCLQLAAASIVLWSILQRLSLYGNQPATFRGVKSSFETFAIIECFRMLSNFCSVFENFESKFCNKTNRRSKQSERNTMKTFHWKATMRKFLRKNWRAKVGLTVRTRKS